jgi:periplasmic copper chaperone A
MKISVLIPALLAATITSSAFAHDYKLGSLVINHPWSRATPKGATVAGGYMKITNSGTAPDRLVSGSTDVARRFEIHEMRMEGGVMKMRELSDGLEIPPGATVELKPGSYHVMMTNLSRQLTKGERVKASLTFEKAGKVDIEFDVEAVGGSAKEHQH